MQPKELSRHIHYYGQSNLDGGLLVVRIKVPKGINPTDAAAAYYRDSEAPGALFANPTDIIHAKRREYIVKIHFGYNC